MFNFIHELYKHINPRTQILLLDQKVQNLLCILFIFTWQCFDKSERQKYENPSRKCNSKPATELGAWLLHWTKIASQSVSHIALLDRIESSHFLFNAIAFFGRLKALF
jgi:hypothetical protein